MSVLEHVEDINKVMERTTPYEWREKMKQTFPSRQDRLAHFAQFYCTTSYQASWANMNETLYLCNEYKAAEKAKAFTPKGIIIYCE